MTDSDLRLRPLGRFPGRRALTWHHATLYASERYALWRWISSEDRWEFVARYQPDWTRRLSSSTRLGSRLCRDGFHSLGILPDGGLVAILPKAIAICATGQTDFKTVWRIRRGTRPLALAVLPDGAMYWGEYFDNKDRDEVHVYGSRDGGRSWKVVYTFPPGRIRHIHSITYDPHGNHLWMCTGDYGDESHIMRVSLDWKTVESVVGPSQQTRTVRPMPTENGLYFATDSELEQNHIYRLSSSGALEELSPTSGPSLWSCRVGPALFFSTNVEPSRVNLSRWVTIQGSRDRKTWTRLVEWRKDRWHPFLFQYGNIILPMGANDPLILAATGAAVEREDGVLHLWEVSEA